MEQAETQNSDSQASGAHPAGVRRILVLIASLAMLFGLTYVLPISGIGELRPWRPGGKLPFQGLFEFEPPTRSKLAGVRRKRAQDQEDDKLLKSAPLPKAEEKKVERVGSGYRSAAEMSKHNEKLRIPQDAYAGMTESIADPTQVMDAFYDKLAEVARDKPEKIARVAVYSDSVNGADRVTSALRRKMAGRFGGAGKGWVPIAPGWAYQKHHDVEWTQDKRWDTFVVNRGNGPLDRYGYGGVLAVNQSPGASITVGTVEGKPVNQKVSRFQLYYQAWPDGGNVELRLDGGKTRKLDTHSKDPVDKVHTVDVEDAPHTLEVEAPKPKSSRLYGVVMERDGPGVVVDGLALIGAFARVLLKWDEAHWKRQLQLRDPDLTIFWLGGNDSTSDSVPFIYDDFVQEYGEVVARARAAMPESSCLVMSPLDAARKKDGVVRTYRDVPRVVEATKDVAQNQGCAFFNAYEAIGGRGTMWKWYHASPRLAASDYRHLTEPGARVVASLFYKALLKGYDGYLARSAE